MSKRRWWREFVQEVAAAESLRAKSRATTTYANLCASGKRSTHARAKRKHGKRADMWFRRYELHAVAFKRRGGYIPQAKLQELAELASRLRAVCEAHIKANP